MLACPGALCPLSRVARATTPTLYSSHQGSLPIHRSDSVWSPTLSNWKLVRSTQLSFDALNVQASLLPRSPVGNRVKPKPQDQQEYNKERPLYTPAGLAPWQARFCGGWARAAVAASDGAWLGRGDGGHRAFALRLAPSTCGGRYVGRRALAGSWRLVAEHLRLQDVGDGVLHLAPREAQRGLGRLDERALPLDQRWVPLAPRPTTSRLPPSPLAPAPGSRNFSSARNGQS